MPMSYHWPGNVRELENCIGRAVFLAGGEAIDAPLLPPPLQMKPMGRRMSAVGNSRPW